MSKYSYLKLVTLLIFMAGCAETYQYSIEMKPCGEDVERKLVWSGKLSNQERERIAKLYQNHIKPNTFEGRFHENLPNDVGGAGFYTCFLTKMGKVTFYSERFRGQDDLNENIEEMRLKVDRGIDFLIGWLEYELGDDPNFDNLRAFCNNNLRQDCKNLLYYFWLARTLERYENSVDEEFKARALHYLLERGYFSPEELALAIQGSEEAIFRMVRRFVADKMGYSDSKMASNNLAFLSDTKHMEDSFERYIPTTDLYKELWEAKKHEEEDPNAEPPDTDDMMTELFFEFDLFPTTHKIEVKLVCDSKPFLTNGQWDAQASEVAWSEIIAGGTQLPAFFYSVWSAPDKKFQEEHFGHVVLSEEALAEYCIWQKSLDEEKAELWDSFLLSLMPNEDLKKKVGSFRFSDYEQKDKKVVAEKDDLAEKPRELILAGLKAKKAQSKDIN